jgi:hypothetical protein
MMQQTVILSTGNKMLMDDVYCIHALDYIHGRVPADQEVDLIGDGTPHSIPKKNISQAANLIVTGLARLDDVPASICKPNGAEKFALNLNIAGRVLSCLQTGRKNAHQIWDVLYLDNRSEADFNLTMSG